MIHIQESWLTMEQQEPSTPTLLEPGNYFFEVKSAEASISSKGNEMITVVLDATDGTKRNTVYDYLVGTEKAYWKIRDFCQAVGLGHLLREGGAITAADCSGKKGKCKVTIDPGENGYADRNTIEAYLTSETFSEKGDDGIPF